MTKSKFAELIRAKAHTCGSIFSKRQLRSFSVDVLSQKIQATVWNHLSTSTKVTLKELKHYAQATGDFYRHYRPGIWKKPSDLLSMTPQKAAETKEDGSSAESEDQNTLNMTDIQKEVYQVQKEIEPILRVSPHAHRTMYTISARV